MTATWPPADAPTVAGGHVPRRSPSPTVRPRRSLIVWTVARGLLGGVALGAAYRAWMALIAPDPSFTWAGTAFIVVTVTVVTLTASACASARQRSRRRWARGVVRVVAAALIVLLLGTPPATVTVPAFVMLALAMGRRSWPSGVRLGLAVAASVATAVTLWLGLIDLGALPMWRAVAGVAGYVVVIAVSAWLFSIPTRQRPDETVPR